MPPILTVSLSISFNELPWHKLSGRNFNEICLDSSTRPHNPMVDLTTWFHEFSKYKSTKFFFTNITFFNKYYIIILVLILSNAQLWKKINYFFDNYKKFDFFFNLILVKKFVDSYLENSRKHVVTSIIVEFWCYHVMCFGGYHGWVKNVYVWKIRLCPTLYEKNCR